MKYSVSKIIHLLVISVIVFVSCNKTNTYNQIDVIPSEEHQKLSVVVLLGDGMGMAQITAAWHEQEFLNLQRYPYTGLVFTQASDRFVTESSAANTAMMTGYKTNYGYIGIDPYERPKESLYEYLQKQEYKTGIISTSFMADATLAALFSHRKDRYEHEEIAYDYYLNYADYAVAGGQKHFDAREDQKNLLDSLSQDGVNIFYDINDIGKINLLPAFGLMHVSLPPYLNDGRNDFLYKSSEKALQLFGNDPFFLFIEGAHIDRAGHDMNIENQISEIIEFDRVAGMVLDYAMNRENILVVVVSDHESGGLTLLQGNGMNYIPNYANDEHSGVMVPVFGYGVGAERFTGMQQNTDIYDKLKALIDIQLNN